MSEMLIKEKLNAYTELYGSVVSSFYALRKSALENWNAGRIRAIHDEMVSASKYTIYCNENTRKYWFEYWQSLEFIIKSSSEPDHPDDRSKLLKTLLDTPYEYSFSETPLPLRKAVYGVEMEFQKLIASL